MWCSIVIAIACVLLQILTVVIRSLDVSQLQIWIPVLELSLGLWQGEFQGIDRLWLRWYDADGNLIPTEAEAERKRADLAETRAEELARRLRELGVDV